MPRHARTRSRRSKPARKPARTYRRKVLGRTPKVRGPFRTINTNDPFRSKWSVKLTYSHNLTLTAGVGGIFGTEHIWRLNSVYDPDFTGTGHQPYGFDEVASLYRKYKVNAVLIDVIYSDPSEDGMVVGMQLQPPNGAFTVAGKTSEQLAEQPMSVVRYVNDSGKQLGRIKQYMPIGSLSGLTPLQFKADVDLFTSAVTTNPTAVPYLRIAAGSDRGAGASTVQVKVKLTFFTTFYERKILAQS